MKHPDLLLDLSTWFGFEKDMAHHGFILLEIILDPIPCMLYSFMKAGAASPPSK